MGFGLLDRRPMFEHIAFRSDHHRRANSALHFFAVHHFLAERAILLHDLVLGSESRVNGNLKLPANLLCDSMLSLLTPSTTVPDLFSGEFMSRKPQASLVQPGVLSLG